MAEGMQQKEYSSTNTLILAYKTHFTLLVFRRWGESLIVCSTQCGNKEGTGWQRGEEVSGTRSLRLGTPRCGPQLGHILRTGLGRQGPFSSCLVHRSLSQPKEIQAIYLAVSRQSVNTDQTSQRLAIKSWRILGTA